MDAVQQVRQWIPGWAAWLPLAYPVWMAGLTWVVARLTAAWMLGPVRRLPADAHWTERARLAFPARVMSVWAALLPVLLVVGLQRVYSGPFCPVPPNLLTALGCAAVLAPGYLVGLRAEEEITGVSLPPLEVLRSAAALWLIALPNLLIAFAAGLLMPDRPNLQAVVIFAAAIGLTIAALRGGGLWLGERLGLVRPAAPRPREIVEKLSASMGIPCRRVVEVSWARYNAFAFPFSGTVGFTEPAGKLLDDAELSALAAHELAHLAEGRGARAARWAMGFLFLPFVLLRPLGGENPTQALIVVLALFYVLLWTAARFSRRMEERADAAAAGAEGDAGVYARALERLYQGNLFPAVTSRQNRGTHPHLYDRLLAAGVTPEYPRPLPPPALRSSLALAGAAALLLIGTLLPFVGVTLAASQSRSGSPASFVSLPFGASGRDLERLGLAAWRQNDTRRAEVFIRAEVQIDPRKPRGWANLAGILAYTGKCPEATQALAKALKLAGDRRLSAADQRMMQWARRAVSRSCNAAGRE